MKNPTKAILIAVAATFLTGILMLCGLVTVAAAVVGNEAPAVAVASGAAESPVGPTASTRQESSTGEMTIDERYDRVEGVWKDSLENLGGMNVIY